MATGENKGSKQGASSQNSYNRASSAENQEIFVLPRLKSSRSRERRESRLFLVDGQLCWADDSPGGGAAGAGEKRHSSVGLMFGSSMDLSGIGQSIDSSGGAGSGNEEAISYRIKWCRENILKLKQQTWPMEKKLQVLKASKLFIKQHQGELKQSKQAKDVIAGTSAIFERYWRHFKREFANFLVIITPWEMRIKKIESHFGSVVASYFTFLRWIFWLNLANSLVMVSFVMVPELIENSPDLTGMRKGPLGMLKPLGPDGRPMERVEFNPTLGEMWEFEGFLKFSPIFYGYYSNVEISRSGFWRNPLAFLLSAMLTYLFCFFCISRKLSQNTKLSRIGSKDDEYTFCWTVFVGWDFMIGNSETAYNKTSSLVMNLKEGILEEKEQTKDVDWRLIIRRVLANVLTIMLIVASAYVVTLAVQRSENLPEDASLLQKNELQLVMSGIQFMFPPLFDVIGVIEKYHPRKALSWQLGRILFLDFLNFYTLMFSLFGTVNQMGNQLNEVAGNITLLRKNGTYYRNLFTTTTTTTSTPAPETTTFAAAANFSITTLNTVLAQNEPTDLVEINGMSTSTFLTSILLASSTMVAPSNVLNETTTSLPSPSAATAPSSLLATTTTATSTEGSLHVDILTTSSNGPTYSFPSLQFTTMKTLTSSVDTITSKTLQTFLSPAAATTISSSAVKTEDDDYPDLGELLKVSARSVERLKRDLSRRAEKNYEARAKKKLSRFYDRSTGVSELRAKSGSLIERESSLSPDSYNNDVIRQTARVAAAIRGSGGVFLPTIRDPYRDNKAGEEEEEPLEGRLEVNSAVKPARPIARRPSVQQQGLARPIGGHHSNSKQRGSRVQISKQEPMLYDDDLGEDLLERSTEYPALPRARVVTTISSSLATISNQIFAEPTTNSKPSDSADSLTTKTASVRPVTIEQVMNTEQQQKPDGANILQIQGKSDLSPQLDVNGPQQINSSVLEQPTFIDYDVTTTTTSSSTSSCIPLLVSSATNVNNLFETSALKPNGSKERKIGFNASEVSYTDCIEIPDFKHQEILALNDTLKDRLKSLCWETMFGQEMVKIVVMDLVMTVISAVSFEFMRACFVRYCNRFFFWDLERGLPGYQDFKLAENVLHLVNNQSTVWMGMFFAPGLPAINTVKLAVLMYVRSWAVLTCNIPHETVFKVSKSNNFYYWILLINLLICILPVAYAVTWIRPSWHCGPFGGECRMYIVVTKLVKSLLPPEANSAFKYLTSPGAVIPILIALILIIYYLASTVNSSKEANKELKVQLKKDKEQEAAVPEITTVVDPTPTPAAAAVATTGAIATPSTTPTPTTTKTTLPAPVMSQPANLNTLAASAMQPKSHVIEAQIESKPKSLLMPPPI